VPRIEVASELTVQILGELVDGRLVARYQEMVVVSHECAGVQGKAMLLEVSSKQIGKDPVHLIRGFETEELSQGPSTDLYDSFSELTAGLHDSLRVNFCQHRGFRPERIFVATFYAGNEDGHGQSHEKDHYRCPSGVRETLTEIVALDENQPS